VTLSPFHIIVILVLGVLFFGKNLPGVAKQIGSALLEFRKGLNEWKEEYGRSPKVGTGKGAVVSEKDEPVERYEALGTKFEPPPSGEV
jgi:sec-independent protein translocase protein TatA